MTKPNFRMTEQRSLFRFSRYAVSIILLAALFHKVDFREMAHDLVRLSLAPALLILGLAMVQIILTSLRWHLLLKSLRIVLPFRVVTEVNVISILANTVLINVIGGIVAKVALLAGRQVAAHVTLATLVLERVLIFVVLLVMAAAGLWLLPISISAVKIPYVVLAPVMLALVLLVLAAKESQILRKLLHPVRRYARLMAGGLARGARSRRVVSHSLLLTIANQLLMIGMGVAIALALGVAVPLFDLAMLLPAVALLASLPISVAGLGVREISLVYILSLYAVPTEQAMLFSVLILFFSILGAVGMYIVLKAAKPLWPTKRGTN